jgi:hypothetical protein
VIFKWRSFWGAGSDGVRTGSRGVCTSLAPCAVYYWVTLANLKSYRRREAYRQNHHPKPGTVNSPKTKMSDIVQTNKKGPARGGPHEYAWALMA